MGDAIRPHLFDAADGTAALPSYTFLNDRDTGFYRAASDQLGVALGGAAKLLYSAGVFAFQEATNISATAAITLTPGAGTNLNITLSATGDLVVNTTHLVVDTSEARVGIGTALPQSLLELQGPIGDGATSAGILTLSTKELTIADGNQLGRINFNAPLESDGGDAILSGAAIWAEAAGTFTATANATELVFGTAFTSLAIERMRIANGGAVIIGTGEGGTSAASGSDLRAPNILTGGAGNIDGADFTIAAGLGTGTGDVGTIVFSLPIVAAAGDNLQTRAARLTLDMAGGNNLYVQSEGTGANGMILKNPKNAAATALSGTQLDVEIDIGGTPYYFTVYPTKA